MGDERSGRKLDSDIFQGGQEPVGVALIPKLDGMQARKTITVEDLPSNLRRSWNVLITHRIIESRLKKACLIDSLFPEKRVRRPNLRMTVLKSARQKTTGTERFSQARVVTRCHTMSRTML